MRLILKDYISTLKEEKELESLLCNLLFIDKFQKIIPPQKGIRQNGVDIICEKSNDVYVFVLKQKDISRSTWNSGTNSIRQTLDEIKDVVLPELTARIKGKIKIILCTNGIIKQEVLNNWDGYIKQNKTNKVEYEFWGIDDLATLAENYLINEYLFEDELKSDLRRALYFSGQTDNDLYYFKKLIDSMIYKIQINKRGGNIYKKNQMIFLLIVKMSIRYANIEDNNRLAIKMSEIAIIKYWSYILENNLFERDEESNILIEIGDQYIFSSRKYIDNISKVCDFSPSFSLQNPLEYRLQLYESLGMIAVYTNFLYYYYGLTREVKKNIDTVIKLINNNRCFVYPVYDLHSIEINSLLILLYQTNASNAKAIATAILSSIAERSKISKYYPIEHENYGKAILMEFNDEIDEFSATNLIYSLYEWLVIFNEKEAVENAINFFNIKFPSLSYNPWQISIDEELDYFKCRNYMIGLAYIDNKPISVKRIETLKTKMFKEAKMNNFKTIKYSCMPYFLILARNYRMPIPPMFWQQYFNQNCSKA